MAPEFAVPTAGFQGPLEALLNLIEARKLSVSDVSLAEVADAYLAYVEKLPEMPLGETAQFVLVASTLLLIKSRSLLPNVSLTDEETRSIEELEKRLKQYAVFRKAAKFLRREWGKSPYLLPKRSPARVIEFNPGEATIANIRTSIQKIIAILPKPEKLAEAVVKPVLALEEVVAQLKTRISTALRAKWSEIVKSADKHETIVHFLAILELVRNGSISATQEKLFGDIMMEKDGSVSTPTYG